LTVLYIHWSEQKKRTVALVAELKAHLVRQMQVTRLALVTSIESEGLYLYAVCVCVFVYVDVIL